jgi:CheY-like chemotaxis protein
MASLSRPGPHPQIVLYVEDDPQDFFLLKVANHKCGAPLYLQRAEDGQEAVAYLTGTGVYADRQKYPFPDLVLLDLRMPRLDGFEVLYWIRSQTSLAGLPVIVFCASDFRADIRRAFELGATACLTKPADSVKLQLVVDQIASVWPIPLPTGQAPANWGLRAT